MTNRRGAILERNCLLKLFPRDLIDDAYARRILRGAGLSEEILERVLENSNAIVTRVQQIPT